VIDRPEPLPTPTSGRCWATDLPGLGVHWWRFPSFVEAHALRQLYASLARIEENQGAPVYSVAEMIERSPHMAAWVGWFWLHPTKALVARPPMTKPGKAPDPDAILAFGVAVLEELEDAGYALSDIVSLWLAVANGTNERLDITSAAVMRAGFSLPPGETGITSP
jgi:hypothetical protein